MTQPRLSPEVVALNRWLIDCLSSGDAVLVPAIRARKASGLARLDAFVRINPNRYLAPNTRHCGSPRSPPRSSAQAAQNPPVQVGKALALRYIVAGSRMPAALTEVPTAKRTSGLGVNLAGSRTFT